MGVIGKGSDHWHETGIKVALFFVAGAFATFFKVAHPLRIQTLPSTL
jgi:hypothetical protein